MTKKFLIVGTDTDIGKTTAAVALMAHFQQTGASVLGLKPLATGCVLKNNQLYNQDALLLQKASNLHPLYEDVNPFKYAPPVSPHIVNHDITTSIIADFCHHSISIYSPDYCLIEGAGGWFCPLNNTETFADLALTLNIPIILVVGIKLGCLNHAMLTYQAILNSTGLTQDFSVLSSQSSAERVELGSISEDPGSWAGMTSALHKSCSNKKLNLHGWIANCLEKNTIYLDENIEYLKNHIAAPLLGKIDYANSYPGNIILSALASF